MKTSAFILVILIIVLFAACSYKKVMNVIVENRNNYSINLMIKANNVEQTIASVSPNEKRDTLFDWTNLNKEEGQFVFLVENSSTGTWDSFSHGFIRNGELYNFLNLICEGEQLKVEVSN